MKKLAAVSLSAVAVLGLAATSAFAAHNVPDDNGTVLQYKVPLVRSYAECTAPNDTHAAPLAFSVCSNAGTHAAESAWQYGPKGYGSTTLKVAKKNIKDYDKDGIKDSETDQDVVITTSLKDLRDGSNVPVNCTNETTPPSVAIPCPGTGVGNGTASIRVTDNWTVSGNSGTMIDLQFPIAAPPGQGCKNGNCTLVTSADATITGAVANGKQANIQIGVGLNALLGDGEPWLKAFDSTGAVFATPGIFIP